MPKKNALILVDLQNDFCHGGNLAVPDADAVIPLANQLQNQFDLVIASKDWHPEDHTSFASNHAQQKIGNVIQINNLQQVLWPDHCIQHSLGSEFHPKLNTEKIKHIVYKGTDKTIDSYSAFFDNAHLRATGLADYLQNEKVIDVYVMGLATDYCVKYTSLDARHLGFNVFVIEDGCRGVELQSGDVERAFREMREAGAQVIKSAEINIVGS